MSFGVYGRARLPFLFLIELAWKFEFREPIIKKLRRHVSVTTELA
jgi:hypothetical protein